MSCNSFLPTRIGGFDQIVVKVPSLKDSGSVAVSVETPIGRSRSVSLMALAPLRVTAVEPSGALAGDEVTLTGNGFGDGLTLTVGSQAATVVNTEPQAVRFQMPKLEAAVGSRHTIVATVGGRSSAPVSIYLGRLPLVAALGTAGARVVPGRRLARALTRVGRLRRGRRSR